VNGRSVVVLSLNTPILYLCRGASVKNGMHCLLRLLYRFRKIRQPVF
jgi:hypothetical protein